MKRYALLTIMAFMALLMLSGCGTGNYTYPFVEAGNNHSVLLADIPQGTLVTYDTEKYEISETMNMAKGYSVNAYSPMYNYYTIGYKDQKNFSIISLGDKQAVIEYSLKTNETLIPFAFSQDWLFFVKSDEASSTKKIVRYDPETRELIPYGNLSGLIFNGTIIGNTLYYTVFDTDAHSYSLYKTDCQDPDAEPQIEQEVLSHEEIHAQGNRLYLTDRRFLYCGLEKRFRKEARNYFIGDKHLLQYVETLDGKYDAVIIDTESGDRVKSAGNLLGVSVTDSEIILYCQGAVERFSYK